MLIEEYGTKVLGLCLRHRVTMHIDALHFRQIFMMIGTSSPEGFILVSFSLAHCSDYIEIRTALMASNNLVWD